MISSVPSREPTVCPHCGAPLGSEPPEDLTPIENYWFFGRRHGPMKRYVEAGLTDREVRRAMDAGIDAPAAIIIFCKRTPQPGHSEENHPSEHA
jgi:hypothetical protein